MGIWHWEDTKNLLIVLGVIAVLFLGIRGCMKGCDGSKNFSDLDISDRNANLCDMAKTAVKKQLKSPSTAKFPDDSAMTVKDKSDNEYEIDGYVDAKNSFNALIRSNFTVDIKVTDKKNDDDTWSYHIEDCYVSN